jgi:hypothetical protein
MPLNSGADIVPGVSASCCQFLLLCQDMQTCEHNMVIGVVGSCVWCLDSHQLYQQKHDLIVKQASVCYAAPASKESAPSPCHNTSCRWLANMLAPAADKNLTRVSAAEH